jgi:hypothetical protein
MTFAYRSSLLFILWWREREKERESERERLSCLERVAEHEEEDDDKRNAGHAHLTPLKLRIPRASYRGGGLPQREYI